MGRAPLPPEDRRVHLTVRLHPDALARFRRACRRRGDTLSALMDALSRIDLDSVPKRRGCPLRAEMARCRVFVEQRDPWVVAKRVGRHGERIARGRGETLESALEQLLEKLPAHKNLLTLRNRCASMPA